VAHFAPVAVLALSLLLCISCGGKAQLASADAGATSAPDAQAGGAANAGGGACGSARVPKEHRAMAQACPTARGSSGPLDMTGCMNRAGITCTKDADCTAGLNGRCLPHNEPCDTACSYDECLTDSDCAAGPCLCRSSGSDTLSNQCLPGSNCKTDADCGNCGYCSLNAPLLGFDCRVESRSYVCHTASDQCTDPGDCDGGFCSYNAGAGWACGVCVPIPRPH
jgi:hypothetical protein